VKSCSSNFNWYNLAFNIFIAASRFLICERSFWLLTTMLVNNQNERSQIKNREAAMKMLKAKLYQLKLEEQERDGA
jgi:CRISPR/Cas system-associated exonuclease Cas4 (RecB family)